MTVQCVREHHMSNFLYSVSVVCLIIVYELVYIHSSTADYNYKYTKSFCIWPYTICKNVVWTINPIDCAIFRLNLGVHSKKKRPPGYENSALRAPGHYFGAGSPNEVAPKRCPERYCFTDIQTVPRVYTYQAGPFCC